MGAVIGDVLPLAVAVLISPIPVIAAILMLLAPQARAASVGFMVGWLVGIVVALVVFVALAAVIPQEDDDVSHPVAGTVKIVLGLLMLALALRQWRGRPHEGAEPALPAWMAAIDTMTLARATALGFALSAINPKNLLMTASAGVLIGTADLPVGDVAVVIAVFTVVAGASVAVPVTGYLVARERMTAPLQSLRVWLVHNNAAVMAVLLLVVGATMVGKGIGSF
ncbi:GAP family protein [Nocardioides sp. YIM 152315]|uniref:GAP family protein n=1 Tax=Nocardioides sp. YIM 152315 TaxID=3031760 RepID=UPI0023D9A48F|nr:GAP family protein [Nocardioides sp. YIM 152315]MDF1605056.1 GAP family protein [Nocardioides sp. YIM 152315]